MAGKTKNTKVKNIKKKDNAAKPNRPQQFRTVKGMADLLPKDQEWWKAVWRAGDIVGELYDFYFMETPILEEAGLFEAGVGAATDIVEKEMYVFKTKGGDRVALRPEGTAAVMRSYLENHLGYFASPLKAYYCGPMFRYERPQAGRYRQHHQLGFEIIGDNDAVYDAQIMLAVSAFFRELKIKDIKFKINTIGCRVCRPTYRQKLKDYYCSRKSELCKDCVNRYEKNPLRLLDCKNEACHALREKAPITLDYLCQACNTHFRSVLELLEDNGIVYEPDPYLVRGLDYYNRTVFEIEHGTSGNALGGGGRYDYLSELLGGRLMPAVGVAIGLERVIETMRALNIIPRTKSKQKAFFIAMGDAAKKAGVKIIDRLRASGIAVSESLGKNSLHGQLKAADKLNAPLALIFGQKEMFEEMIIIRDMKTGAQESFVLERLVEEVKRRIK